jgi:phytoene dehydrogenase-like protein
MRKKSITVNIIGGGIGALSCGAYLAKQGVKINIFERLDKAGGVVKSFSRSGYMFEASTHQMCGLEMTDYMVPLFKELGITDLELIKMPHLYESIFYQEQGIVARHTLPVGKKALQEKLLTDFPADRRSITAFLESIEKIGTEILRLKKIGRVKGLTSKLPLWKDFLGALILLKGKDFIKKLGALFYPGLVSHRNRTYQQIIQEFGPHLQQLLSQYAAFLGTAANEVSGIMVCILYYLYGMYAPYLIKGGSEQLVKRLVESIEAHGGQIYYNTPIKRVLVEGKQAKGVISLDDKIYTADYIVSDISTQKLFLEMIEPEVLPEEYLQAIKNLRLSPSAFQVYVGTRLNLHDYGFKADTTFFNPESTSDGNETPFSGVPSDHSLFAITNYSLNNDDPVSKTSLAIFEFDNYQRWATLSDNDYQIQKNKTEQLILEKVEKIMSIPLRNKAEVVFSATPKTFQHYLANRQGETLGPIANIEQALTNRTSFITPLSRLFLVGAYTQPSGGISACLDNGFNTAMHILDHKG